jgi:hypothetical protein
MNDKIQELIEKCKQISSTTGSGYSKYLVDKLMPIIAKCDNVRLDEKSDIEFKEKEKSVFFQIIPKQFPDALACVYFNDVHLILSFSESEVAETHRKEEISEELIDEFIESLDQYLRGIYVKEYRNAQGNKIKREYFYKDGEKIGTSTYRFLFGKKIKEIKEMPVIFYKKD